MKSHANLGRVSPRSEGDVDHDGRKIVAVFRPVEDALIHLGLPGLSFFNKKQIAKLDLDGKLVSLDAMHSRQQTARQLVLDAGPDYSLTIKENTPEIKKRIETKLPKPNPTRSSRA